MRTMRGQEKVNDIVICSRSSSVVYVQRRKVAGSPSLNSESGPTNKPEVREHENHVEMNDPMGGLRLILPKNKLKVNN